MPVLTPESLFEMTPGAPSSPLFAILGIIYLMLLGTGILLRIYHERLVGGHRLLTAIVRRVSTTAIVLGGAGVILVLSRYLQVPLLSMRFLLFLVVMITIVVLAYGIYYYLRVYPARMARFNAEELRRRYMPRPKGKPSTPPSRASQSKRGKKHH